MNILNFGELVKGKDIEAESTMKEKHVPTIEILKGHGGSDADLVRVIVGKETAHPNTVEHHIAWVELYGRKDGGEVVNLGRVNFSPGNTKPDCWFKLENIGEYTAFCALGYCNIHGLWENCIEA
ncbi:class II SORL domain-containing protein [Methanococcoides cohabitans]|uniref:class II SORL domain-containing protein n=1 Tax=Methanococcoides cohabitans TaxID=3136559 RepID=UPI003AF10A67